MAVAKTQFWRDKILNLLKNTSVTGITTCYVGLFTAAPNDAYTSGSPTGTEVPALYAYVREAITWSTVNVVANTGDNIDNSVQITFPTASGGNWGTIVDVGIFDAATAGNLMYFGLLGAPQVVNNGNQFIMPVTTGLVIQES